MGMRTFDVAGVFVRADGAPTKSWRRFGDSDAKDCAVRVEKMPEPDIARARILSKHEELIVRGMPDGGWLFESPPHLPPVQVLLSADQKTVRYHLPKCKERAQQQIKLGHLLRTAMECRFCQESVVSLHAACVTINGEGVAFTGHSGLGKSTRARAWVKGLGAAWLSGDRPAVRVEKERGLACGVPWDGKEQIFRNEKMPMRCILEVRRSPENYVRRLTQDQARQLILQQSFVPMWDTNAAVLAMANARALVRRIPVYRVFCGPDAQDAKEIYDILWNHPEQIREEAKDMKRKEGFVLRNVVDEYIVMPTGDNIAKFEGAVVLNEVSAYIFEKLENAMSREDLLSAVMNEYEVDEQTAARDLDALLNKFESMGILE